jgi:lipopolysaccharide export LptBFGC system permease protein LptF
MKNLFDRIRITLKHSAAAKIVAAISAGALVFVGFLFGRAALVKHAVSNRSGDGYVDTAVKILIAVVIGALVLAALYALFSDTVMPAVVQRVRDMFNYNG